MSTERKGVEFFVGLFLLIGFGVIATMVVIFGRAGQGLESTYTLTVEFPNASGLVKGGDVLLAGARIGTVAVAPQLIGDSYAVAAVLHIRTPVKIPRTAEFQIRSSGMLGDSYVDVLPPAKFVGGDFLKPDERISAGRRANGLDELTAKGSVVMDTINNEVLKALNAELAEIKTMTTNINTKLLNDQNLRNLEQTFANLRETTAGFAKTSKDLDTVVARSQEAVDAAKVTLKTVDMTAGDVRMAIGDFRKVADSAKTAVDSARVLLNKAATGEGTLGTLVSDRQTADNLRSLIANLRRSGVLFYKDRPLPPTATPAPLLPRRR